MTSCEVTVHSTPSNVENNLSTDLQYQPLSEKRNCVKSHYLSFVGIREISSNDSPEIRKILKNANINSPSPYCASFVKYILDGCDIENTMNGLARSCCPGQRKVNPETGDVVAFDFVRDGIVDHVGFVHEWQEDKVVTVEANTSDPTDPKKQGIFVKFRNPKTVVDVKDWID